MKKEQLTKNKKIIWFGIIGILFFVSCFLGVETVGAQSYASPGGELDSIAGSVGLGKQKVPIMVGLILKGVFLMLGVMCLVVIVYAGISWTTAQGNQEKITTAKAIMKYAAIGIVIVLFSYVFTYYAVSNFEKAIRKGATGGGGTGVVKPSCGKMGGMCEPAKVPRVSCDFDDWQDCGDDMYCCFP